MIKPKTKDEIALMQEGGKRLAQIKKELQEMVKAGVRAKEIDKKAEELIKKARGKPSFEMVKGYRWATCINVNEGVVHGVPGDYAFREGDLVSIDVGMFFKGYHTDTSFTVGAGKLDKEKERFLAAGRRALKAAIDACRPGMRVAHISRAMQKVLEEKGYSPVRALSGHGIGKNLHESPQIPCFWQGNVSDSEEIPEGAVFAIEAIYTLGSPELVLSGEDKWTIATRDGKIAGLFEETVAATVQGPLILTA